MSAIPPGVHPAAAAAILDPERLSALDATRLLGTDPEAEFDRLTALAARVAAAPVALVTLVGAEVSFFKSAHGLPETPPGRAVPLSHSLCQHVVGSGEPLVIDDARAHPLVRGNGGVTDLGVGAYLGVPVRAPSGHVVGSLCAIDLVARVWSDDDRTSLVALAASVEGEIALREQLAERERAESRARRAETAARSEAEVLAAIVGVNALLAVELDPDRLVQAVVDAGTALTGAAFGAFFYSPGRGAGTALLFAVSGAPRAAFERLGDVRMTPLFEPSFSGRASVRSDDVQTDPRYGQMGGMLAGHLPVRSYLSVPVHDAGGGALGALLFGHPEPGVFGEPAERLAEAIATQATIALQNARLHQALDESERRHRTVLANLNDVVFQTDRDGHYTYLNAAWETRTGHAVADAVGRHCFAFSTGDVPAISALVLALTEKATSDEDQAFQIPVEILHADGSTLHFEANWRLAYDEFGAHAGWAGTYTDVTDTVRFHTERRAREAAEASHEAAEASREAAEASREAAEVAREAAEVARVEAERMARLQSAFLANMSHEIRTPLTAILGYAEILADEVPGDLREFAVAVRSGGERLLGTLNAVLDLAQIEAGRMVPRSLPVAAGESLAATVRALRPLADAKGIALELELDVPSGLPAVLLDPGLLDRVVTNLVGNAVKFTERGEVQVRAWHDGERLWVEVADTGIGIAPDALERLFEPFEQASDGHARTHEGNGLGLAIVRDVVALMGGAVTVESVEAEGSRFRVSMPAPLAAPSPAWTACADRLAEALDKARDEGPEESMKPSAPARMPGAPPDGEPAALVQLVYASSAIDPYGPAELARILRQSRRNNEAVGVTGVLLYSGGNVMQALEGSAEAVDATFRRVQQDSRHRSVTLLYRGRCAERSFPDWSMGLRSVEDLPEDERESARSLFDLTEPGPDRAHRLLASFRALAA